MYYVLALPKPTAKHAKLLEHYAAILTIERKLPSIQVLEDIRKALLRALGSHKAEKFGLLWFLQVHAVLNGQLDWPVQLL